MGAGRRLIAGTALLAMAGAGFVAWRVHTGPVKASDIGAVSQPAATKAVVTATDMPDENWTPSPADPDEKPPDYAPKACARLAERPAASTRLATSSFERSGSFAAAVVETIYRPAGRTPAQEVAQLRALVSPCSSYRYREGETKGYAVSVKLLPVTQQATDTLGIRSSVAGAFSSVSDSIIWVAAGDAVVRFDSITAGDGMTQKDLEKLVKTSLKRLRR